MRQVWTEPTQEQQDQALLVQIEVIEALNRMRREGFDPRILIAGLAAAAADTVTTYFSNEAVAPWFAKQAEMVDEIMRDHRH